MNFSSIVKKTFMAFTGLALVGFLVTHLAGNLMIFSPEKFNAYAHMLEQNPLLVPAEIALLAIFLVHIYMALKLTAENRAARTESYEVRNTAGESTWASRNMMITGVIILFFVIIHVKMFKYGDKTGAGGLWGLVIREFKQPQVAIFYVASMIFMGFHLSHAISSALQSLGALKPGVRPKVRRLGAVIGWGLAIGFAILPLWAWLIAKDEPSMPNIQIKLGAADLPRGTSTSTSTPAGAENKPAAPAHAE
ncbi:MAG TPA: succinate dehydrogenase cytochrome b subunit [Planctomycetota bacterium]|nr:succinate dehydrogenase cytochrome b subunit [Planctomycetota bacterium]